ncbi:MAG: sigma-70 family RNA polymerase sigma factor [Candidatus Hydrogenedentales bacterium]|jgi:RNA polymerase sigma factor (sigma-70 family)
MLRLFHESDRHLASRAQAGDQEAFGKLVHRYIGIAHAVAYAQTGNRHDSEDIAQDVFLAAYQALGTLRDTSSFGPWLTTMARNKAIDLVRKRERRAQLATELDPAAGSSSEDPASHERHEIVRQQVMALEEGPREVLLMHYFAGKSVREIAAALHIEKPAAQKRLARARETLSANLLALLQEEGAVESRRKEQAKKVMAAIAALPKTTSVATTLAGTAGGVTTVTNATWTLPVSLGSVSFASGILAVSCILVALVAVFKTSSPQTPPVAPNTLPTALEVKAGTTPAATEQTPLAASINASASMDGWVADHTAKPLLGVNVIPRLETTDSKGNTRYEQGGTASITDQEGRFHFEGLRAGSYGLFIQLPGDTVPLKEASARVALANGQAEHELRLVFDATRGTTVFGYVLDTAENPVQGAYVSTNDEGTTTDAKGYFSFVRFEPGLFHIRADHPVLGWAKLVNTDAKPEGITLVLMGVSSLSGRVIAQETRRPISNFEIAFARPIWTESAHMWQEDSEPKLRSYEDSQGRFIFDKMPADPFAVTVVARAPGRATRVFSDIHLIAGETAEVELALELGRSFHVRVVSPSGDPIPNAEVCEGPPSTKTWFHFKNLVKGQTDANGDLLVENVADATTQLSAFHPDYPVGGSVDVPANVTDASLLQIRLGTGATIEGSVFLGDKAVEKASIDVLYDAPKDAHARGTHTDANGNFKLTDVPEGQGRLRATITLGPGMMNERVRFVPIAIAAGQSPRVDIHFPVGQATVEGKLSYNDAIPPNMGVQISIEDGAGTTDSQSVPVGADGTYRFEDAAPGTITFILLCMLEPNSMGAWPTSLSLPLASGGLITQDFIYSGAIEDPEKGFWAALVAAYPDEESQ